MTIISLIVAMDKKGLIGAGDHLPWRLPEDMKHFREVTMGKPVIMGRKTFETIPDRFRPLAGRTNIILTRQEDFEAPGCLITHSVEEALSAAGDIEEVMVIGGSMIYAQFLPLADRIYLTLIDHIFTGDIYFPQLDLKDWVELERERHSPDEKHAYPFAFILLKRQRS